MAPPRGLRNSQRGFAASRLDARRSFQVSTGFLTVPHARINFSKRSERERSICAERLPDREKIDEWLSLRNTLACEPGSSTGQKARSSASTLP